MCSRYRIDETNFVHMMIQFYYTHATKESLPIKIINPGEQIALSTAVYFLGELRTKDNRMVVK